MVDEETGAASAAADGEAASKTASSDAGQSAADAGVKTDTGSPSSDAKDSIAWPDKGFPDDWKNRLIEGMPADAIDKAKKYLGTRASAQDILKAALSADSKISEMAGRLKPPTGKNDDPKDVVAWNKAMGIPETHEKYAVYTPEGVEQDDFGKEVVGEFLKDAHKSGMGQKAVDTALKSYYRAQAMAAKAMETRSAEAAERCQEDLRVDYGRDYKPNIELANRLIREDFSPHFGDDGAKEFLSQRFQNGMALGEDPRFVRLLVSWAKQRYDDGQIDMGAQSETGGKGLEQREAEILSLMHSDPKEYDRRQPELKQIIAAQNKQKKRS